MSSPVNIVCAADERFAMPLAIMLRSAAIHSSRPLHVYILNNDLTFKSKQRVEKTCAKAKLHWLDVDPTFMADVPTGLPHLSKATYFRLAIGKLLPAELDRIIYLDSDVLVIGDLAPLFDTDLQGNIIGAIRDFMTPLIGQPNALSYCVHLSGLNPAAPLFNAGVMLLDLAAYRASGVEGECIRFLQRWRDEIRSADQDAFNAVLANRWKRLPFRWNVQVGAWNNFKHDSSLSPGEQAETRTTEAAVLHFSGAMKPWNSGLRWPECRRYVHNVHDSGWYGPAGFLIWKAKRTAACVRNALINRMAAKAGAGHRAAQAPAVNCAG
jgi:lipopolysaccharide biosynthesis glycosyltransferase